MFRIHMLPAGFGDSLLLEYGRRTRRYILVDGGPYMAREALWKGLRRVAPRLRTLELLVVTHVDIDHIDGIIQMLNRDKLPFKIREIWFNGYREMEQLRDDALGALQGELLSHLIRRHDLPHNTSFQGGPVVVRDPANPPVFTLRDGMRITLLAPGVKALLRMKKHWTKETGLIRDEAALAEYLGKNHRYRQPPGDLLGGPTVEDWQEAKVKADTSVANRSSIAFLAEYDGKKALLAGDSPGRELQPPLQHLKGDQPRLALHAWKLAHHGSKGSTPESLMALMDCPLLMVSSNGAYFDHPDPECLAKCLKHQLRPTTFAFNFRSPQNKKWADADWQEAYAYSAVYPPAGEEGLTVTLA